MAVMMFCDRFPPSMTGMPACAGDMVVIDPAISVTARATLAAKNFCFICFLLALVVKRLVRLRERHVLGHDDVEAIAGADFQVGAMFRFLAMIWAMVLPSTWPSASLRASLARC
jgi:hypothetical protein